MQCFFFLRQFLIWKALPTSKKNWQQSNFQLVSNLEHCYLLAHLNMLFVPVSAPAQDNSDVGEIFRQERVRLQQIRSDQETARNSADSRLHRKQEIDKMRKRPNQSVPGSKLVVYVFCLSFETVTIVIFTSN